MLIAILFLTIVTLVVCGYLAHTDTRKHGGVHYEDPSWKSGVDMEDTPEDRDRQDKLTE